jgi:uncharacterized membrane protein YphA (DoxX/SURF4 family)
VGTNPTNHPEDAMATDAVSAPFATTATATTPRRIPRYLVIAARLLLGLLFFVPGLNYFVEFIPPPTDPVPAGAMAFAGALFQTGYMFPLIKGTEVLGGALLLSNRFVPLALVLLAPVMVNIVAFHAFLAPSGIALTLVMAALQIALAWAHRAAYRPLLTAR